MERELREQLAQEKARADAEKARADAAEAHAKTQKETHDRVVRELLDRLDVRAPSSAVPASDPGSAFIEYRRPSRRNHCRTPPIAARSPRTSSSTTTSGAYASIFAASASSFAAVWMYLGRCMR